MMKPPSTRTETNTPPQHIVDAGKNFIPTAHDPMTGHVIPLHVR